MARRREGPLTGNDISLPQEFRHVTHVGVNSSRDLIVDAMLPLPKAIDPKIAGSPTKKRYGPSPRKSPSPNFSDPRAREVAVDVPSDHSFDCYEKPRNSNASMEGPVSSRKISLSAPRSPRMGVNGINGVSPQRKIPTFSEETPIFSSDYHDAQNARNIRMGLDGVLYQNVPEASFGLYNNIHALGVEAKKSQPPPLPPKKDKKWTMQQDDVLVILREGPDSFDVDPPVTSKDRQPSVQINAQPAKIRPPSKAPNMERPGFLGMGFGLGLGLGLDDPIPLSTPPSSYTPHEPMPPPPLPQFTKPSTTYSRSFSSEPPKQEAPSYEPLQGEMVGKRSSDGAPVAAPRTSTKAMAAPLPPTTLPDSQKKIAPPRPPPPAQWLKPSLVAKERIEYQSEDSDVVRAPIAKETMSRGGASAVRVVQAAQAAQAAQAVQAPQTLQAPQASQALADHKPRGIFRKRSEIKLERVRSLQDDFEGLIDEDDLSDEEFYSMNQKNERDSEEKSEEKENTIQAEEPLSYPIPPIAKPIFSEKSPLHEQTIKQLQEQLSIRKNRQKSHESEIKQIATDLSSEYYLGGSGDEMTIDQPTGYANPQVSPLTSPATVHRSQSSSSGALGPPPDQPFPAPKAVSPGHTLELHVLTNLDDFLETYEEEHQATDLFSAGPTSSAHSDLMYIDRDRPSSPAKEYPGISIDPIMKEVFENAKVTAPAVENLDILKEVGQYPAGKVEEMIEEASTLQNEYNVPRPLSQIEEQNKGRAKGGEEMAQDFALYLNVQENLNEKQETGVEEQKRQMRPIPKPRKPRAPKEASAPIVSFEDSTKPITIRL